MSTGPISVRTVVVCVRVRLSPSLRSIRGDLRRLGQPLGRHMATAEAGRSNPDALCVRFQCVTFEDCRAGNRRLLQGVAWFDEAAFVGKHDGLEAVA